LNVAEHGLQLSCTRIWPPAILSGPPYSPRFSALFIFPALRTSFLHYSALPVRTVRFFHTSVRILPPLCIHLMFIPWLFFTRPQSTTA
jgi:hypothetical protein